MSHQESPPQPDDGAAPSPTVVAWGDDPPSPERRSVLATVARDPRLVLLTVALGALAILLSLLSEWQVTVVHFDDGEVSNRPLPARIDDLAGWASGYLVGLLVLTAATVLLLYGPPAVRRSARLVALSTGGVLLAVLAAILSDLRMRSQLNNLLELTLDKDQVEVTYGRGLWCAIVGVAAVTIGVHLAGRHLPADVPAARPAPVPAEDAGADLRADVGADVGADEPDTDFSWRRPHGSTTHDDEPPDAPLGLTVEPTAPFTRPLDNFDRPG